MQPSKITNNRATLISVITTPLGFFALALLTVEGFLGIGLFSSPAVMPSWERITILITGAVLFLVVVIIVTILVWHKPQYLAFSGTDHLKHDEMFGTKENPKGSEKQVASMEIISDTKTKTKEKTQ